jgi:cysteinyl-tRNA synthetase
MTLKIYNTQSQKKEEFKPVNPGKVAMYLCGVTVYDECHVGHARGAVAFDLIYRYLQNKGFEVTYARNFTDIDDNIIRRSQKNNVPWKELTEKYMGTYTRDMKQLGLKDPTVQPKATEHIQEMIELIQNLEEKGLAYNVDGNVFYAVKKFESYGKLSHKNIDDLQSGARVDVMEQKKDPLDFALWKKSKEGEPAWDSPWGKGRPGWHLECSAMGMKYLGESFDIHGGGRDLIFPHHENEIAQSEGSTGKNFANIWMHNGYVNIDSEKMSKSTGKFRTLKDILEIYHGESVRYFLLSAHYRSPIDYSDKAMQEVELALDRIYTTLRRFKNFEAAEGGESLKGIELKADLESCLDDDFNTTKFLGKLFDTVRNLNNFLDTLDKDKKKLSSKFKMDVSEQICWMAGVLGLFGRDPDQYFEDKKSRGLKQGALDPKEIEALIAARKKARTDKDWAEADRVRSELDSKGVLLKDNPDGTTEWHVKS